MKFHQMKILEELRDLDDEDEYDDYYDEYDEEDLIEGEIDENNDSFGTDSDSEIIEEEDED